MSKSSFRGEILSFDPFKAEYDSYDGTPVVVTFTCPHCGGHSVKRVIYSEGNRYFFESGFRCLTCCKGSYLGERFNYYSSAFVKHRPEKLIQLTLF